MARNLEHFCHGMFFQQKIHSTSAPTEVWALWLLVPDVLGASTVACSWRLQLGD